MMTARKIARTRLELESFRRADPIGFACMVYCFEPSAPGPERYEFADRFLAASTDIGALARTIAREEEQVARIAQVRSVIDGAIARCNERRRT